MDEASVVFQQSNRDDHRAFVLEDDEEVDELTLKDEPKIFKPPCHSRTWKGKIENPPYLVRSDSMSTESIESDTQASSILKMLNQCYGILGTVPPVRSPRSHFRKEAEPVRPQYELTRRVSNADSAALSLAARKMSLHGELADDNSADDDDIEDKLSQMSDDSSAGSYINDTEELGVSPQDDLTFYGNTIDDQTYVYDWQDTISAYDGQTIASDAPSFAVDDHTFVESKSVKNDVHKQVANVIEESVQGVVNTWGRSSFPGFKNGHQPQYGKQRFLNKPNYIVAIRPMQNGRKYGAAATSFEAELDRITKRTHEKDVVADASKRDLVVLKQEVAPKSNTEVAWDKNRILYPNAYHYSRPQGVTSACI